MVQTKVHNRKMEIQIPGYRSHVMDLSRFFEELDERNTTIEFVSREEVEQYHLKAINLMLNHVWNNNDYYRRQLENAGFLSPYLNSLKDYSKVPFLYKNEIKGDKDILLCVDRSEIGQIHSTSGTSGESLNVSYTLADHYIHDGIPKYTTLYDDNENDVIGIALPYEFHQPGLGFQRLYQFIFGATVLSLGKGGYLSTPEKTLKLLKEFDATIMVTTPSYASLLAEESEKMGVKLGTDIQLKKILITGEGCSPQFRKRLEEWWQCPVHFIYGSTECGVIGVECSVHHGYHIMAGHVFIEVVDPSSGVVLEEGEIGEIVVSTILRDGMPFIRYRTGDLGFIQKSECGLGINLDMLHLRGRMEGQLMINETSYSPFLLEQFLLEVPDISLWYHFVVENNIVNIEVEPFNTSLTNESLAEKVRSHMHSRLGIELEVRVHEQLPRTFAKAKRVLYK